MPSPSIVIKTNPPGPKFPISDLCVMPNITATVELKDYTPNPKSPPLQYKWKVTLIFNGQGCANATQRVVKHNEIEQTTPTNSLTIPFTQVRGGAF